MANEIVLICSAYPHIENVLYLSSVNYQSYQVRLIVHGDEGLFKFFSVVNEKVFNNSLDIRHVNHYSGVKVWPGHKIGRLISIALNILAERRYLNNAYRQHLSNTHGADVYFFKRYYAANEYYYLKKLADSNKIIFMPARVYSFLGIHDDGSKKLKEIAFLERWKLAYGMGISMNRESVGIIAPYIPEKFFKKYVQKTIEREEQDILLQDFDKQKFKVFNVNNYEVIYFHDNLIGGGYVSDPAAFTGLLSDVFDILKKYVPQDRVSRKLHPNPEQKEVLVGYGDILPDYIPAEFLYNDNVKMYLGLSSMALAGIEKGVVVSLIEMVPYRDDKVKKELKAGLVQASKSEIKFPRSLEEFQDILKGIFA